VISRGTLRLLSLREQTEAVEEAMVGERERFTRMAKNGPTEAVSSHQLFQTPKAVAERMASILGPLDGMRCLEPSAGLGRLVDACEGGDWTLVEQSPDLCRHLYARDARLIQGDFLSCDVARLGGLFDRAMMNPPFTMGTDIRHICRAFELLRPGGVLVSLCYNGAKQNAKLRPLVDSWEVLPESSFASEGTRASVALVVWKRGEWNGRGARDEQAEQAG
jgi:phospholipid N-methyltransferase